MTAPDVWVVTPVHNRRRFTEPFLRCLHRQSWTRLHIVIVDDGSTDGTTEMIRDSFPGVTLLRGNGNLWWTAAVNLGIRHVLSEAHAADYVLVMNDDLEVESDFVDTLLRFAAARPRALVGAPTVDASAGDWRIEDGGVRINWWTAKHQVLNRGRAVDEFPPGHYERPSYLTGRTALIPTQTFREVGLYDAEHFLNCGDTELPVRAAQRGWELYVCYDTVVCSHVDAVARENRGQSLRLTPSDIRDYYFGIKSYTRLKYRYHFARTAARGNPLRFAAYLVSDVARITVHLLRERAVN